MGTKSQQEEDSSRWLSLHSKNTQIARTTIVTSLTLTRLADGFGRESRPTQT